ncbi:MAG: hypothetical protein O7F70_05925 [Gemmatimonadetes bacterium]|nr:hypothetical protein [Gemmatimonadota bacterium]
MPKRVLSGWVAGATILACGGAVAGASNLDRFTANESMAQRTQSSACLASSSQPDPTLPDLDCPAPPNTFDVSSFFASNADTTAKKRAGPTWDAWAWASFAAMNWPAKEDSTQQTGYLRGVPDTDSSFVGAQSNDVVVWQTFKEKREVFNSTVSDTSKWQNITFDLAQQPMDSLNSGGVMACTVADSMRLDSLDLAIIISQGVKSSSIAGDNTLDEVVEVASPALESAASLCAGLPDSPVLGGPDKAFCTDSIFPDNNKNIRSPVGPRVWKGDPGTSDAARAVLFEVKVNYDFWNYIVRNGFYDDSVAYAAARGTSRTNHPKLPFRTSSAEGPGRSPNATFDYDAASVAALYDSLPHPDTLPPIGSVQLKAAWLMLTPEEVSSNTYLTTDAVYYKTPEPPSQDTLCYAVDTFGLIGLHIIQRVHAFQGSRQPTEYTEFAHGGTFVFATWEHTDLPDSGVASSYYYANFLAGETNLVTGNPFGFSTNAHPFPNFTDTATTAINVIRMQNYPLPSTTAVNDSVHASIRRQNSSSVWLNYRLIGTQFVAVGSDSASLTYNQPYYLANLVVETNQGLQHFRGLPPNVTVTPYYTDKLSIAGTGGQFAPTQPNVIFNRQQRAPVTMGGCMGCHGVAQLNGYNFSFVFQDGQRGSVLDTQTHFNIAPDPPSPRNR